MDIKFQNPGMNTMLDSIMHTQGEGASEFWAEPIYYFYPKLDREYAKNLKTADKKREYIGKILGEEYKRLEQTLNDKTIVYHEYWEQNRGQIEEALSEVFSADCHVLFNDLVCEVSMNPISPRFLQQKRFEVFYLNSECGALGVCLHELIHFLWFYVWHNTFQDAYEEYEQPSLKWILSEMVVETIMSDERLASLNPYFPREAGGCVYPYFFDMQVDEKPILELIDALHRKYEIVDFMKLSYQLCLEHEAEIRCHIEKSEKRTQN